MEVFNFKPDNIKSFSMVVGRVCVNTRIHTLIQFHMYIEVDWQRINICFKKMHALVWIEAAKLVIKETVEEIGTVVDLDDEKVVDSDLNVGDPLVKRTPIGEVKNHEECGE